MPSGSLSTARPTNRGGPGDFRCAGIGKAFHLCDLFRHRHFRPMRTHIQPILPIKRVHCLHRIAATVHGVAAKFGCLSQQLPLPRFTLFN